MPSTNGHSRMILAVANERDDHDVVWDQLKTLPADMFAAGPVAIKFAYFGRETAPPARPFISTRWVTDPDELVELLNKARSACVCGCFVNIADIFAAALEEARQAPVQALVVIADTFHGDTDATMSCADELYAVGTRLFLFHQSVMGRHSVSVENTFRALAERTAGAYFVFNPATERVAERLPGLLGAVAHFAIGGTQAVEKLDNYAGSRLLYELRGRELGQYQTRSLD